MELTIRADARDARRASEWLESSARDQGVPPAHIVRLDHCLDEVLANVFMHGGTAALASSVLLQLGVRRRPGVCTAELVVVDAGAEFDSSASSNGPTPKPASLAEAGLGGLGLAMIRSFSDDLSYRRSDGQNHLTISVRWTEAA
ncbi:MAG: ATP-binding protein [Burkholderiales bacterium]|nr:ATP-binding protein [Burkholderiales bacterium]